MRKWRSKVPVALAVFAAFQPARAEDLEQVCTAAPRTANLRFTLPDVTGNDLTLSDYRGNVILLDFWATWCAPCRVEIPVFIDLYETYRERGFVVLGVSVNDPVAKLEAFVAELGMSYPVLVGADHPDLQEAFGPLVGFPTSFLIRRDGTICVRHVGIASKEDLEREIQALL